MARRPSKPRTRRNPVPLTPEQKAQIDALPVWLQNAYTGERLRPARREEYREARPGRNTWDAHKRMVRVGYGDAEVVGEPYNDGRPSFLDDLGLRLVTRFSKELLGTSTQEEYEASRDKSWEESGGIFVDRPDIPRHAVTWAGFPWPREALLYHATRALGPISREGFKTRRQGTAAMGGGRHVYSISLTLVPERAAAFALAFDTLARVAQGKMSLRKLVGRLAVETPRALRFAMETDRPLRDDPEAVARLDDGLVLASMGDKEAWMRPENVTRWQDANPDQRVYVYDRAGVAFSLYSACLRGMFSGAKEAFNPVLVGTDMAALAKTPLSDIGMVVARTSIPRICAEVPASTDRLGYTIKGDSRSSVAMSEQECENDIEAEIEERAGGTRFRRASEEARAAFASRARQGAGSAPYARLDTNFEVGERTPETTMVFNEGEEEVRIFDPAKITVVETWDMPTIRRMFNLGDRITFPNFSSDEKDISLWPLLKDAPLMRDNPRTKSRRTRRNGFFASKEERERKEREKTKVERGLDTARTAHATAAVGIMAAKAVAPQAAATVGAAVAGKVGAGVAGRAVPFLGEALMVAGAGKEAYKVVKRRKKEGWKSGSWKTDLAKVGAGAVGLEDFVPDAPKKNPRRRNPPTPEVVNYALTDADRAWFAGSKVVDERGLPLVLYHGSQNPNLKFHKGSPVYATSNYRTADGFADGSYMGFRLEDNEVPTVYVLFMHMENPRVFATDEEYERYFQDVNITPEDWKRQGYDGLIYLPEDEYGDPYYAVFGPEQVRVIAKYEVV